MIDNNVQEKYLALQSLVHYVIRNVGSNLFLKLHLLWWKAVCYLTKRTKWNLKKKKKPKIKQVTMQIWNKKRIDLEATIKALKDGTSTIRRHWWQYQDWSWTSKHAAFCWIQKQTKKTLVVSTTAQENLEGEYMDLLLKRHIIKTYSEFLLLCQ